MPLAIPCCVDVPRAGALVRYGLEELLRGLGAAPVFVGRGEARVVVSVGEAPAGAVHLSVTAEALDALVAPRMPDVAALGTVGVAGERWPVPVGPPGEAAPGDLVAGAAWWLAGLGERANDVRDRHGRVPATASLQAAIDRPGGLLRPAVDAYRRALADTLRVGGIATRPRSWGGAPFAVALTHDLDALRLHRLRALAGGLARRRPGQAVRRLVGPDRRAGTIDALAALGRRHGDGATWFVKPGRWAPEDPPVDLPGQAARVRALPGEVGWHPGYGAHADPDRLAAEHAVFERALGAGPRVARTHYLRWAEPATPRLLEAAGVRLDSTLGFADAPGFRRGTAHPFRIYDLDADRPTDLWEMPLAVMDTTLVAYQRLGAAAQAAALDAVVDGAAEAGGCAVVLWHNQLGDDDAAWDARLATLDAALTRARARGAAVGPLGTLLDGWAGPGWRSGA